MAAPPRRSPAVDDRQLRGPDPQAAGRRVLHTGRCAAPRRGPAGCLSPLVPFPLRLGFLGERSRWASPEAPSRAFSASLLLPWPSGGWCCSCHGNLLEATDAPLAPTLCCRAWRGALGMCFADCERPELLKEADPRLGLCSFPVPSLRSPRWPVCPQTPPSSLWSGASQGPSAFLPTSSTSRGDSSCLGLGSRPSSSLTLTKRWKENKGRNCLLLKTAAISGGCK